MAKEIKRTITDKAHDIAKTDFGATDAKAFMDETNAMINSKNDAIRNNGLSRAAEFTKKLTLLMLYQEIDNMGGLTSKYEWVKMFNDGRIPNGNSKQYLAQIPTGYEPYESDDFNPKKKSLPKGDSHIISMYERDAQGNDILTAGAYQFNKPLTIQANEWLPYFKAGVLSQYIANLQSYMRECYEMFIIANICKKIKELAPAKEINITETNIDDNNLFLAMVNDIIPIIEDMKFYNSDYNYEVGRGTAHTINADDIIIITSYKTILKLRAGVMSRVFHSEMISPTNFIPESNWIGLNKELIVPVDSNEAITTGNDVLDDNTMYIMDKGLIKHLVQVEESGNQGYINNMTIQHNLHVWGVIDLLPWKKCVKYTNVNLNKQPN